MDKAEFARRAKAAAEKLYGVACAYLPQPSDREDAIQDALLRAWQKRWSLRETEYFETWLTRILINVCVDQLKRKKREVPMETLPEPIRYPDDAESLAVREMLDKLAPSFRIVVVLHYMEGYELQEVARILRLPLGTVKSRLFRARKQMQTILRKEASLE